MPEEFDARKVVFRISSATHANKRGEAKIIPHCTLPLTGQRCIDMIITDLCVLQMNPQTRRFRLAELAPGVTVDQVRAKTTAEIEIVGEPALVAAI